MARAQEAAGFHVTCGNLSHQIEHHMFPDIPGVRYAEISVKVQDICQRYGQHYNSGSFPKQFSAVVGRIFKYALPFGKKKQKGKLAEVITVFTCLLTLSL